jgi:tetratricopeptide (TPR) repeat protein
MKKYILLILGFIYLVGCQNDNRKPYEYFAEANKLFGEGKELEKAGRKMDAEEKFKSAIEANSKGLKDSTTSRGYGERGWCYLKLREYDKALQDFEKAIGLDSKDTYSYNGRAVVYRNKGDIKSAIADYSLCINLEPKAFLYSNRGNAKAQIGDFTGALEDYDKAIELRPQDAWGYNNRARTYLEIGKYQDALKGFSQTIELEGNNADAYKSRAVTYELLGDKKKAEQDYTIYRNLTNVDAEEFIGMAYSMMKLGRLDEALGLANQAIKLKNTEGWYYDVLADIQTNMNDPSEAEINYKKAHQLGEVGAKFWASDKVLGGNK